MAQDRRADPDCSLCHGTGCLIENERMIGGEYWCSFLDCDCIPVTAIPESMRARFAEVAEAN